MPELPEVETVRRHLEGAILGRTVRSVRLSGKRLRGPVTPGLERKLRGRTFRAVRRHGKYLLADLDEGLTLISHLGMSGRWLFRKDPTRLPAHVHARIAFDGGAELWFQDPRRFGLLRLAKTAALGSDPGLRVLGPDPIASPPTGEAFHALGRRARVSIKVFLLDQKRIAGIGNIYASEILHRALVDPRRRATTLTRRDWDAIARETSAVLAEAIARMGTTFSDYRTVWNEPGEYGAQLLVYDRVGEPCRRCGAPIRRLVQAQRSTYYCGACQRRRK
jgi:formamidopyrimidine-DNA glycosylase